MYQSQLLFAQSSVIPAKAEIQALIELDSFALSRGMTHQGITFRDCLNRRTRLEEL